jgi:hypothetical protein
MSALAAFVSARLDEDETAATEAARLRVRNPEPWYDASDERFAFPEDGTHIARHDPARVLREVEAGRARVALYLDLTAEYERTRHGADMMRRDALLAVLRYDAAAWSDHPDYRPEWKP